MANAQVLSHWDHLQDRFQVSTVEFYSRLEAAIADRQLPAVTMSRVTAKEGGIGSADRLYFRVQRGKLTFDVCSAQYGTGHFFSWWLVEQPMKHALLIACLALVLLPLVFLAMVVYVGILQGPLLFFIGLAALAFFAPRLTPDGEGIDDLLLALPFIGHYYRLFFKPVTYYATDTRLMFQESVHRAVTGAINDLLDGQGLRALAPENLLAKSVDPLR